MNDEGVIKFRCEWIPSEPLPVEKLLSLIECRQSLYALGLIGAYPDGIGFGNISFRNATNPDQFMISGTQTGDIPEVDNHHFTLVTSVDVPANTLTCAGPIKASSESMTHAALYSCSPQINAVIHIHNLPVWEELQGKVPTTGANVPYGTPAMVQEIIRLYNETNLPQEQLLVMAGHREGVIAFGSTLHEAFEIIAAIPGISSQ